MPNAPRSLQERLFGALRQAFQPPDAACPHCGGMSPRVALVLDEPGASPARGPGGGVLLAPVRRGPGLPTLPPSLRAPATAAARRDRLPRLQAAVCPPGSERSGWPARLAAQRERLRLARQGDVLLGGRAAAGVGVGLEEARGRGGSRGGRDPAGDVPRPGGHEIHGAAPGGLRWAHGGTPPSRLAGPINRKGARRLDRLVLDRGPGQGSIWYDTIRCPFEEGDEAYPGAAIRTQSHVQIAVRDGRCISPTVYLVERGPHP